MDITSGNIELSKPQLSKIVQIRGFLGRLFLPLLKNGLSLKKNVMKPLAKSVLKPLTVAVSAIDAAIEN